MSETTGQVWEEKNLPGQVSSKQRETRHPSAPPIWFRDRPRSSSAAKQEKEDRLPAARPTSGNSRKLLPAEIRVPL